VRVAAKVIKHLSRTSERRFGIDHPFDCPVFAEEADEGFGVGQGFEVAEEFELSLVKGLFEVEEELAPKHL